MDSQAIVRKQLLDLLHGGNAHMGFDEAFDHFPMQAINASPPGSDYTPWRLLEHIRIAQWDILEFVRDPNWGHTFLYVPNDDSVGEAFGKIVAFLQQHV